MRRGVSGKFRQLSTREIAPWALDYSTNPLHDEGDTCKQFSHSQPNHNPSAVSQPLYWLVHISQGQKSAINKSRPDDILLFCLWEKKVHECRYNYPASASKPYFLLNVCHHFYKPHIPILWYICTYLLFLLPMFTLCHLRNYMYLIQQNKVQYHHSCYTAWSFYFSLIPSQTYVHFRKHDAGIYFIL